MVKISNDEFDNFYEENKEKFKKEYKKLQTLSKFESDDDKTFWKEFVMKMFIIDKKNKEWKINEKYWFSNDKILTKEKLEKLEKFKKWLILKNVEPVNDSEINDDSKKKDETKIDSGKWKLWFLTIIPIVPIVIFLFIYFIKKSKNK